MELSSLAIALTIFILVFVTLIARIYYKLEDKIKELRTEIKESNEQYVICKKSKMILRKEDAHKVEIRTLFSIGRTQYEYYSPMYAPNYNIKDLRLGKYYKRLEAHEEEVKIEDNTTPTSKVSKKK